MILLDQLLGVDAIFRFPCVVAVGISFPFKEVLQLSLSSFEPVIDNSFHLVFVFASDQFGWWSDEIGPMRGHFAIG
jgi:hypothetical protein